MSYNAAPIPLCAICDNTGLVVLPEGSRDRVTFCTCDAGLVIADAIAAGVADIRAGRTRPWAEVRKELGLPEVS